MSTAIQSELTLFATEESLSAVATAVARILKTSRTWLRASDLIDRLCVDNTESARRHIRSCAEELGDEVISGQLGYKHIDCASNSEVEHFCNWMDSQGDKMKARAARTRVRKGL